MSGRRLLEGLGPERLRLMRLLGRAAIDQCAQAYLVGGSVRDLALGRENRDLDVVVEGEAGSVASHVAREFGALVRLNPRFGTASLTLPDRGTIDLATARREYYPAAGALPEVEPAAIEDDLRRRDFTINCLALDLSPRRFGRLIDPLEGLSDLRGRSIRVLHGRSFIDDPTRILRALRFACRLGFQLVPETGRLIREAVRRGMIARLSAARLRREISAGLDEEDPACLVAASRRFGILKAIDPALDPGPSAVAGVARLRRVLAGYRPAPHAEVPPSWAAVLTLLTLGRSKHQRRRLIDRLRPDRRVTAMLLDTRRDVALLGRRLASGKRHSPGEISVACQERGAVAAIMLCTVTRSRTLRNALGAYLHSWNRVTADIGGKDLLAAGLRAGPAIARGLEAALVAKLDGRAAGPEEQLEVALRAAGNLRTR